MILEQLLGPPKARGYSGNSFWDWVWGDGYGSKSAAGVNVTPTTALSLSAYWACIANISQDVAKLPIDVVRKRDSVRTPLPGHPVEHIFNVEFNPDTPAMLGRQTLSQWAKGWGNGYAEIERNGIGRVIGLHPIHPSRVTVKRNAAKKLYYEVMNDTGAPTLLRPDQVFHLPGRLSDDGITGISIAKAGCDSIGRAIAVQKYGSAIFSGGGTDRIALEHAGPGDIRPEKIQLIRKSWMQLYGDVENQGPAVLQGGLKAVRIGIPPEDAQMLEVTQFTVEDLARWFRCPPSKIGHFLRAQGWSTLEALNTDYVIDTLLPEAVLWEQEIRRKLLMGSESNVQARHNFNMLLRGDSAARAQFYTALFRLGVLNRNEIRQLEDQNPVDGGDVYYIEGSNLQPIPPGGIVEKPEDEPEPAIKVAEEMRRLSQPEQPEPVGGEQDAPEGNSGDDVSGKTSTHTQNDSEVLSAAQEAVAFAFRRLGRKEAKAGKAAMKKHLPHDPDGFKAWVVEFYGRFRDEVEEVAGPVVRILSALGGTAPHTPASYTTSHKAQLLAVLRDSGPDGVAVRLDSWGQS